jgi:hypothetical protein
LLSSPKIDEAVRSTLVPNSAAVDISDTNLPLASELAAATPVSSMCSSADAPIATYSVVPSDLDQMSAFLLRGERRKAVKYALDHQMWAHAFIISSCVDTDCWKEVVTEFLRSELSPRVEGSQSSSNGREGLRVAYGMFAGLDRESSKPTHSERRAVHETNPVASPLTVQQFVPPRPLALPSIHLSNQLLAPTPSVRVPTPVSPNYPDPALVGNLPETVLANWQETVAMIVANRAAGDSATLTALGDTLMTNGWVDAAHVW